MTVECALKLWNRGLGIQMSMLGHELLMFSAKMRGSGVEYITLSSVKTQNCFEKFFRTHLNNCFAENQKPKTLLYGHGSWLVSVYLSIHKSNE